MSHPLGVFDTFPKRHDCTNKVDEADCTVISFLAVLSITLGIVLMGVVLFLVLSYSGIMDIPNNNMEVSRTGTEISVEDEIIDQITLGTLSNSFI